MEYYQIQEKLNNTDTHKALIGCVGRIMLITGTILIAGYFALNSIDYPTIKNVVKDIMPPSSSRGVSVRIDHAIDYVRMKWQSEHKLKEPTMVELIAAVLEDPIASSMIIKPVTSPDIPLTTSEQDQTPIPESKQNDEIFTVIRNGDISELHATSDIPVNANNETLSTYQLWERIMSYINMGKCDCGPYLTVHQKLMESILQNPSKYPLVKIYHAKKAVMLPDIESGYLNTPQRVQEILNSQGIDPYNSSFVIGTVAATNVSDGIYGFVPDTSIEANFERNDIIPNSLWLYVADDNALHMIKVTENTLTEDQDKIIHSKGAVTLNFSILPENEGILEIWKDTDTFRGIEGLSTFPSLSMINEGITDEAELEYALEGYYIPMYVQTNEGVFVMRIMPQLIYDDLLRNEILYPYIFKKFGIEWIGVSDVVLGGGYTERTMNYLFSTKYPEGIYNIPSKTTLMMDYTTYSIPGMHDTQNKERVSLISFN